MRKKIIWLAISCLMVLSLVTASCGKPSTTTTTTQGNVPPPTSEQPQYGGTLTLLTIMDYWGLMDLGHGMPELLSQSHLWDGDWAKGPAGGYGQNLTNWDDMTNIIALKTGFIAQSWHFDVDSGAGNVTFVFEIRQGVHYGLNQNSDASKLVNGREVTADDVVWNLDQLDNNSDAMNYRFFPQIHGVHPVKTGPWEVSVTHPIDESLDDIMREVDNGLILPPELYEKYGNDSNVDWHYDVGAGPYMITDSIPSNTTTLEKNPDYFMTDPVGPGKGNQLPYIQTIKVNVVPDVSTQQAALRTSKVDQMGAISLEDKNTLVQQSPDIIWATRGSNYQQPAYMRIDRPPFDNIKVREAMMMSIDMKAINDSLYSGLGTYPSWPYYYTKPYADLYMGLDDPICPQSVKDLFTYNVDQAKQLLTEAGYPDGFKTTLTCQSTDTDYYSVLASYWSKIGVDVSFVQEPDIGTIMGIAQNRDYDMIVPGVSPPATYPEQFQYTGSSYINGSMLDDPKVNAAASQARALAVTDEYAAMKITKNLMPYLQSLALVIQTPRYPTYTLWWPWIKNYSGETSVGYFMSPWAPYVWIDQNLKKSMGY
jgi:peptide/nickel transport system substrate-binding protein